MRRLIVLLVLGLAAPVHLHGIGARVTKELASPPPGATLPVVINRTLKPQNLQPGQPISAQLIQTVPVSTNVGLPKEAKLDGHIINVNHSSISILFDHLRWKGQTIPIHVRLLAAAAMMNVFETGVPLSGPDRGTADRGDWTTRQVGATKFFCPAGPERFTTNTASLLVMRTTPACMPIRPRQASCPMQWGHFRQRRQGFTGSPNFPLHLQEAQVRQLRSPRADPTGKFEMAVLCC